VDVKDATRALDQLGLGVELTLQLGGQTGGLRAIVSLSAVFDADVHRSVFPRTPNKTEPRP
jgi:hypothetical protein